MKRMVIVFLVVGVILFWACSAQMVNAQSTNMAQKIIGTWVDDDGNTWVFNANGILKISKEEFKFGITETKLFIKYDEDDHDIFDISISSDGKTLILSCNINDHGSIMGVWLTKK